MIQEEQDRRNRLQAIRDAGANPYPTESHRTKLIEEVISQFEDLESANEEITICGRIIALRKHGGISFFNLQDASGKIQIVLHKDTVGEDVYNRFHDQTDVGDFYECHGRAFVTKNGEKSLKVTSLRILSKSLLPLPEKFHGLSDVEKRYRQRYLDLIANPEVMEKAKARARMVTAMRNFLAHEGFLEVETPVLQAIPGGANAQPFVTHHNTLHADLYMRIAPELYLKRLLVGGFEKIYEFARCFRNEGISPQHNPEFTQIEAYWAYANIEQLTDHIEKLILEAVRAVTGGQTSVEIEGKTISFADIPRKTFREVILENTKIDLDEVTEEETLKQIMTERGVNTTNVVGYGDLVDHLYKTAARPKIEQPVFVTDYPAAMKPLAKRRDSNPHYSASVQLVILGMEMCNGFNELNDPLEQEERFKEQEELRVRGSEDSQRIDNDYIEALKHGMPPAAGYGIGIDRLAALLTGSTNLKEVILFPTLKPIEESPE
ncbi:lysine--tRNA ligase [Candidatus Uhrbacteria bacterium CG_4_9_14_0_2_um_filter_41_50]|uniref:Lysine--tRNA ligase n=1 Tax=Candidatus Uhrbacteria bacterium CG_4_9_14_0_2_um_filter_41_50 TaxID=1975031 RepID=A0A2M8EP26_9BACT|nr:MAG: lysine--tRNA ligase [Candidatus Uhrbacteria bacterium CG_4_10_14_3_um_filter_41_21]PIZ54383.1 MAG: lysine--tRNA ligase [Candidatus Uhrbacteria bacterium CG_4_10_14_0_2_um_filter_41_21]PJB84981.1 MAG: lysine--tRNA ligase [Candidatus Uhrbacteria bacterium CG_4_9_14_0_8_um_filter_41_16]PJC24488.1 MAG: lysine--tRNA ligase [Candidatus Uhrbacteria bacterium CG_4_9_14_0_2_um_filter_41_50]PJE74714.1 MAG: lysine--tRNA ligase [Candidatus Uhrbacteria bacterium CG10_big_fil_rev_8_21_14_0_10_41_26]